MYAVIVVGAPTAQINRFFDVGAEMLTAAERFAPENIARLMGAEAPGPDA